MKNNLELPFISSMDNRLNGQQGILYLNTQYKNKNLLELVYLQLEFKKNE